MALLSSKFTLKEHPSELPKYWQEGSQHFKQVYNNFELGHILDTWACVAYVLWVMHTWQSAMLTKAQTLI